MNRRHFMGALTGGVLGAAAGDRITSERMRNRLEALSVFGRPAGGTFRDGVSRVGYSDADIAGRKFATDLLRQTGAEIRVDAAGNIFAARAGTRSTLPPVLIGSHIDSVPGGGNFDGTLGSLAAIEVLRVLNERKVETRHPVAVVIWSCEEASFAGASLNGSRLAADRMPSAELQFVSRGMTKAEGIKRIGGDPARLETARLRQGQYHAYVELHIEQGGTLERDRVPVGVVDGIVSIDDYDVVVTGVKNHAGTTPMPDRRDAMIAAAALTLAVRETAMSETGAQVGTVGHLEVSPNAVNVIPGEVKMSIEFRDLSTAKLDRLGEKIRGRAAKIAADTGTQINLKKISRHEPAMAAAEVQRAIEAAAKDLRLESKHLPSGAGHDAQMMATLMPMGMIFVPSVGGVSHAPQELTRWEDCANGANMLLETVLRLAGV